MNNAQKDFWFTLFWFSVPTIGCALFVLALAKKATGWLGSNSVLTIAGLIFGGLLGAISGRIYLGVSGKRKGSRSTVIWTGISAVVGAILVTILVSKTGDWIGNSITLIIITSILGGLIGVAGALLLLIRLLFEND